MWRIEYAREVRRQMLRNSWIRWSEGGPLIESGHFISVIADQKKAAKAALAVARKSKAKSGKSHAVRKAATA